MVLADYGAEVTKVESPDGDILRRLGGASRSGQLSPKFIQMNRSKRSLAIDLKSPHGQRAVRTLIERADIMVVNMRSAALAKLGLTFEDARALSPRIVHCAMMGFGRGGRHFDKPAYDSIIQGGGGIAACFERQTGEPRFVPMVLADHLVSLIAVADDPARAAVPGPGPARPSRSRCRCSRTWRASSCRSTSARRRSSRPAGRRAIPVSSTRMPGRCGLGTATSAFPPTRTGRSAASSRQSAGRTSRRTRGFATVAARRENVSEYFELRNSSLAGKTTAEWMAVFERLDVPAFPFNSLDDLLEEPHLREAGLFETLAYPDEGEVRHMRPANILSGGQRRWPDARARAGGEQRRDPPRRRTDGGANCPSRGLGRRCRRTPDGPYRPHYRT